MSKIKHERTCDFVIAGYRVHKSDPDALGSLLLGLYDDRGVLNSVGVVGALPVAMRRELFTEMQPLATTFDNHPRSAGMARRHQRTRARYHHKGVDSVGDVPAEACAAAGPHRPGLGKASAGRRTQTPACGTPRAAPAPGRVSAGGAPTFVT
jgi:ATP-dependent DNA ligase